MAGQDVLQLAEETLSFGDLAQAVERVYRAFIDTKLMEILRTSFKKNHGDYNHDDYKNGVKELREECCGGKGGVKQEHERRFLYWCDMRAAFWWNNRTDVQTVLDQVVPSTRIEQLYAELVALEDRIQHAQAAHGRRGGDGHGKDTLEALLQKAKGAKAKVKAVQPGVVEAVRKAVK